MPVVRVVARVAEVEEVEEVARKTECSVQLCAMSMQQACAGRALRRVVVVLLTLVVAAGWVHADSVPPAPTCPPVAQVPTEAQIREGAAKYARDRGVLWRITRDGHSSYLFGTIHVGRFEWLFPGPVLGNALRSSEVLALELDPTDPEIQKKMQTALTGSAPAPAPAPVPGALPGTGAGPPGPAAPGSAAPGSADASFAARVARQTELACLPAATLSPLPPFMQAMTLNLLVARSAGLDASYAQEFLLAGMARSAQRRIVSLETPELQAAILLPESPERAQQMAEDMLSQLEQGTTLQLIKRLADIWENGDLAQLETYEQWCKCVEGDADREYLHALNDGRNQHIAEGIDKLHAEGNRVFAAVGALHMSGTHALPKLMATLGYSVERMSYAP